MGNSSAPQYQRLKMASTDHRQAACTHINVTRLFDPHGCHKCQMCGHPSQFGWLYRCTQDYNSFLPKSEFSSAEPESVNGRLSEQVVTSQLSPSILKGIQDGQYTAQQIRLLQAQKLQVKELIAIQEERLESSSESSQTSSSLSSLDFAIENSDSTATKTPKSSQHRITSIASQAVREASVDHLGAQRSMPSKPKKTYAKPLAPTCHFKCCQSCRPAYRDRAFRSLDTILSEPIKRPPQWELDNRRISDASLVKAMGIYVPRPQLRRMYQTLDDLRNLTGSQTIGRSENEYLDSVRSGTKESARRRSGFRETVRKALHAIEQSKHLAKSSKHSSRSSSRDSLMQISRSMLFKRRPKHAEKENQIVSNRALQESLVLMLAVNTPLPHASEDSDSLDGGEVQVEDGVAVTEEGVGMSAADIIMQV